MIYYKDKARNIIKTFILIHLVVLAVFGMVKCTRLSVLSVVWGSNHVRDHELLFNIVTLTKYKNIAYNAFLDARRKDGSVRMVSFSPMDPVNNLEVYKKSGTDVFTEDRYSYDHDTAIRIYDVLRHGVKSSGEGGLSVLAFENAVVFTTLTWGNCSLVYSVTGLYPDTGQLYRKNNVSTELVRISLHWFNCFYK
jgi:hypothetical protein